MAPEARKERELAVVLVLETTRAQLVARPLLDPFSMAVASPIDVAVPHDPRRLRAAMHRFPELAGGFAIVVGGITLVGWLGHVHIIVDPAPRFSAMVAMTAVMSVLSGLSLLSWVRTGQAQSRHLGARVCAAALCGVAAVSLIERTTGLSLGIERLAAYLLRDGSSLPALPSALSFLLLGAALMAMNRTTRKGRFPADVLAFAASVIAAGALLGHVLHLQGAHRGARRPHLGRERPASHSVLFRRADGAVQLARCRR